MALIVSYNEDVTSLVSLIDESPSGKNKKPLLQKSVPPLFSDAISGTDIDFIRPKDPDTFLSISYKGRFPREIPKIKPLLNLNAYVFEVTFTGR